jgi:hypothetical protein
MRGDVIPQKMSQSQKAARAKIMAWAHGDESDTSLPIRTVLDTYIPPDIKGSGQYFTSAQTGVAALENLKLRLPVSPAQGSRTVSEPEVYYASGSVNQSKSDLVGTNCGDPSLIA